MAKKYKEQLRQSQLERDRDMSKVKGYPSDASYMATVDKARIEKQQNTMSDTGMEATRAHESVRSSRQAKTAKEYKGVK